MATNEMKHKRSFAGVILIVMLGHTAPLHADEINLLAPQSQQGATRPLFFPADQCMGNLYCEPETGVVWDLKRLCLQGVGEWDYVAAAQNQVPAPVGKKLQLMVRLALNPTESSRFRRQNPQAYQLTIADRIRQDPEGLSGLLTLEPNDLSWLYVFTELYRRMHTHPRVFEPIGHLTGLQMLTLYSTGITDKGLVCLRPLRSLRSLELTQFGLGNQGLAVLKDLPALEYLSLNTDISDTGLKQVAEIYSLRWLRIIDGRIWGAGLAELKKLPHLERLCFQQSRHPFTDRHIKYLEGLPHLKGLTFWGGADSLTDASLASIGKLKNLEELYFILTSPKFTVKGLSHLKTLPKLKVLELPDTWAGPEGVRLGDKLAQQVSTLPNLESLSGVRYLSNEGMQSLTALTKLRKLRVTLKDIKQGYTGPTGLSHLADLSSLEEFSVGCGENTLSAEDFISLEPLHNLKVLNVVSAIDEQSLATIGKLKQLERLVVHPESQSGLNHLNGLPNLHTLRVTVRERGADRAHDHELLLDLSDLKKLKELRLDNFSLHDNDLAFLEQLPMLENLLIAPSSNSTLTGDVFRYIGDLPVLDRLYIGGLDNCNSTHAAYLNGLKNTRRITLQGAIDNAFIRSMTGPLLLESLTVNTNHPITQQTVDDFAESHPVIEFVHIREPMIFPTVQSAPLQNKQIPSQRNQGNRNAPR